MVAGATSLHPSFFILRNCSEFITVAEKIEWDDKIESFIYKGINNVFFIFIFYFLQQTENYMFIKFEL